MGRKVDGDTEEKVCVFVRCLLFCMGVKRVLSHRWKKVKVKGKAIPLQAWTGSEGSRRLRLPGFKTFSTRRW
jgi:hypothetical protein